MFVVCICSMDGHGREASADTDMVNKPQYTIEIQIRFEYTIDIRA